LNSRRGGPGSYSRSGAAALPRIAVTLIAAFFDEQTLAVFGVSGGIPTILPSQGRYKRNESRCQSGCQNLVHHSSP
jgi:hypothetical protein